MFLSSFPNLCCKNVAFLLSDHFLNAIMDKVALSVLYHFCLYLNTLLYLSMCSFFCWWQAVHYVYIVHQMTNSSSRKNYYNPSFFQLQRTHSLFFPNLKHLWAQAYCWLERVNNIVYYCKLPYCGIVWRFFF